MNILSRERVYQSVVESFNGIFARRIVTVAGLRSLLQECLRVRATYGQAGLIQFAQGLPSRYLSPADLERLQHDPHFPEVAEKLILLSVEEGVIRPREARVLYRMLTAHTGKKANGKRRMRW